MIHRYGILSDTHGHMHPDIVPAFEGVEAILHAGDVVDLAHLRTLQDIAPTWIVAGNCDPNDERLPTIQMAELAFGSAGITHGHLFSSHKDERVREMLDLFKPKGVRWIVYGHSHHLHIEYGNDYYIINPGAACPPRFRQQATCCLAEWNDETNTFRFDVIPLNWKNVH